MKVIIMSEEERYSVRQIDDRFRNQTEDLKEHMNLLISPLTKQVTLTNGTVKWQTKMLYMAIGALMFLIPWAGWVTTTILSQSKNIITQEDIDRAVDAGFARNLEQYP